MSPAQGIPEAISTKIAPPRDSRDYQSGVQLGRIEAARMERMTLHDSPDGPPGSSDRAILANHFDRVLTARRREATGRPDQRADPDLIEANHSNHDRNEDSPEHDRSSQAGANTGKPRMPNRSRRFCFPAF